MKSLKPRFRFCLRRSQMGLVLTALLQLNAAVVAGQIYPSPSLVYNNALDSAWLNTLYYLNETPHDADVSKFLLVERGMRLEGDNLILVVVENPNVDEASIVLEIINKKVLLQQVFRVEEDSLVAITPPPVTGQSLRPYKTNRAHVPVTVVPGRNVFALWTASVTSFEPMLLAWSPALFDASAAASNSVYGPYYGVMAFVLVFALFLAIAFRTERVYLYYALYTSSVILMFLDFNGIGSRYLWPGNRYLDYEVVMVAGALSYLTFTLFTREFFNDFLERGTRLVFNGLVYAFMISLLLSPLMFGNKTLQVIHYYAFMVTVGPLGFLFIAVTSIRAYWKGFKPGIFIAVGVLFLFAGTALNIMRLTDVVGENVLTLHSTQFGSLFEMITLTLGLAYWFKNNYDERRNLQQKVVRQQLAMSLEKERVARDLHDNIGSQLSLISMDLARLSKDAGVDGERVERIQSSMNDTLVELRDTIWATNKEMITLEEIGSKVSNLLWRLRESDQSIDYRLELPDTLNDELRPTHAVNIYRIVQEAVTNARRHSGANKVTIRFERNEQDLSASVQDNGRGLSQEPADSDHYGLQNMRKRAQDIGAELQFITTAGEGTQIKLRMSLSDLNVTQP